MRDNKARNNIRNSQGSIFLELASCVVIILVFVLGIFEFGRLIGMYQMMSVAVRESGNVASRGGTFTEAKNSAESTSSLLDLKGKGFIAITELMVDGGALIVLDQWPTTLPATYSSQIATQSEGNWNITIPNHIQSLLLQLGFDHKVFVVEVFHPFNEITPFGALMKIVFPDELYEVGYFAM